MAEQTLGVQAEPPCTPASTTAPPAVGDLHSPVADPLEGGVYSMQPKQPVQFKASGLPSFSAMGPPSTVSPSDPPSENPAGSGASDSIGEVVQLAEKWSSGAGSSGPVTSRKNNTGIPDHVKAGVEQLSGMSLDSVKVHYNSPKPAQLNAHAYAQGQEIHMAPGQDKHIAHEAWHVTQQANGRVSPTTQFKSGTAVNDDAGLEREADIMGAKAIEVGSAMVATGETASGLQSPSMVGCLLYLKLCLTALVFALVSTMTSVAMSKCEPLEDYGFLTTSGPVPANFPGVLYWDPKPTMLEDKRNMSLSEQTFALKRLDRQQTLEIITTPLRYGLILITPKDGFEVGARYQFKDLRKHSGHGPRSVEVTVLRQTLGPDTRLVLKASRQVRVKMITDQSPGCQEPELTDITYRDIEIDLPKGHDAFNRLFHVEFSVGDTPWRNRKEVCMIDMPGHNWMGPNFKNRIFAQCDDPNKLRHDRDALPFGQHTITAVARLPGSSLELKLEPTQVGLKGEGCGPGNETRKPAQSHGCGCHAFIRSPGPGGTLALTGLFGIAWLVWRRQTP